ncbi:MAG TPA: hypothetical protein VMW08_18045 [Acidimicrobiales bacterium]|nr:hypothetical protein [Acidimicrobiales bacterium]
MSDVSDGDEGRSEPRHIDRLTARMRAEAGQRVDQMRGAARRAASTLGTAVFGSALAAVTAWLVLFGLRIGSGTPWVLAGVVVLTILLVPAAALWYLRRQLVFIANLPDQLVEIYTEVADTADPSELKAQFDGLSGKRGLRLALAIGSLIRWARSTVDLPSTTSTTQRLGRLATTVPLATGIGVVGTVAVVLLIPMFAIASGALLLVN